MSLWCHIWKLELQDRPWVLFMSIQGQQFPNLCWMQSEYFFPLSHLSVCQNCFKGDQKRPCLWQVFELAGTCPIYKVKKKIYLLNALKDKRDAGAKHCLTNLRLHSIFQTVGWRPKVTLYSTQWWLALLQHSKEVAVCTSPDKKDDYINSETFSVLQFYYTIIVTVW